VLGQEKIEADDAAVALVAREAAGSMRDGMSLLDQAIAWGGDKLVGSEVSRVLGVASRSVIHQIAKGLLEGDAATCLNIVADLSEQGYDVTQVARGILAELRDLVVAKVCREPDRLLDLADEESAEVKALATSADADDLLRLHHGFSGPFDDMAKSADVRAALEMLLVRLARRPALVPMDDLVTRLAELEQRLSGGSGPQGPSRSAGGGGGATSRPPNRGGSASPGAPPGAMSGPSGSAAPGGGSARPGSPATRAASSSPITTSNVTQLNAAPRGDATGAGTRESPPFTAPSFAPRGTTNPAAAAVLVSTAPPAPTSAVTAPAMGSGHIGTGSGAPATESSPRSVSLDAWRAVLGRIRAQRAPLASILEHASPIAFSAERVVLGYEPGSFLAAQATEASHVELLTKHVREYFGTVTPVAFDLTAGPKANASIATLDTEERKVRLEQARRAVAEHPLVRAAIDILGAELKDVRVTE
jgi:DNA polymerase-3 subunit gamma/tau